MNNHNYNPLRRSESQLQSLSQYSPARSSLNEVFALLQEQQQQQQDDRQLTRTSNMTANTGSATLPPNTLNSNQTSTNNNHSNDDQATNIWANLLAITWLFVFMWFCCRGRPPGPEHWRGAEIRRRYLERVARERARKDRKLQNPEYRRQLFQHNMHTRTVIAKDEEGNWTLGPVNHPCQDPANISATTDSTVGDYDDEEDDENEYSCVICLDPFHVGDVVSWSRFSEDCHHVYHADCIQPWLQGKRQDECPSCRNKLMLQPPPGFPTSDAEDADDADGTTNASDDNPNGADANTDGDGDGDGGDIETGTNSNATQGRQQQQQVEEDDELDKEEEEDSFFVIMHGLISRVAKRASYSLIGTKDSMDEKEDRSLIPPPSPFRRVVSYEPMRSSPYTAIMNRSRPNSFARSTSPTSMSFLRTIPAVQRCDSEESTSSTTTSEYDGQDLAEQVPFRRVQSDIVGSTLFRQQHQQQDNVTSIGVNTTVSNMKLFAERTLAPSSSVSNDDGDDHRDSILHTSSSSPTTDNDNNDSPPNRTTVDCSHVRDDDDVRVAETMETHEADGTLPTPTSSNDMTTQTDDEAMQEPSISELEQ